MVVARKGAGLRRDTSEPPQRGSRRCGNCSKPVLAFDSRPSDGCNRAGREDRCTEIRRGGAMKKWTILGLTSVALFAWCLHRPATAGAAGGGKARRLRSRPGSCVSTWRCAAPASATSPRITKKVSVEVFRDENNGNLVLRLGNRLDRGWCRRSDPRFAATGGSA